MSTNKPTKARSPQFRRMLRQYKVETEWELVRAIKREYEAETGDIIPIRVAQVMLDRMLEAEYQRMEGGAYD